MKRLLSFLLATAPLSFTLSVSTSFASEQAECPHLVLYYSPYCPYCQVVLKYLNSIHKTVEMRNVRTDAQAKQELKEYGGKMQVPCLFIDGKALYESTDIVSWLSEHQECLSDS